MSVDAQRLMDLMTFLNALWSSPFQIIVSLYFLYNTMGVSILAGVGVMILMVPTNILVSRIARKLQVGWNPVWKYIVTLWWKTNWFWTSKWLHDYSCSCWPAAHFLGPLTCTASIVMRVRDIVCLESSVVSFSNHWPYL